MLENKIEIYLYGSTMWWVEEAPRGFVVSVAVTILPECNLHISVVEVSGTKIKWPYVEW
jgi:hypothetical protein